MIIKIYLQIKKIDLYERLTKCIIENNDKFFQYDISHIERIQFTYYNSNDEGCYKKHISFEQ